MYLNTYPIVIVMLIRYVQHNNLLRNDILSFRIQLPSLLTTSPINPSTVPAINITWRQRYTNINVIIL